MIRTAGAPSTGRPAGASLPRENPFRTERLDRLAYRSPATGEPLDPELLLDRFEELGLRGALVGPEGSGKTTLLDALARGLTRRGFDVRRLRAGPGAGVGGAGLVDRLTRPGRRSPALPGAGALSSTGPSTVLIVDGLDRLAGPDRRRIGRASRQAAGLLAAVHRRPRGGARALPALVECTTSPVLLAALVLRLTAGTAVRPEDLPPADALHARHRGDLRSALLELYDLCAGR